MGKFKINKEKDAYYFKMAADKCHVDAICRFAFMLERGDGIEVDKSAIYN